MAERSGARLPEIAQRSRTDMTEGMGFFQRIKYRLHKRRTVRRFSSYVDPELVDHVINHPGAASGPPVPKTIDFVLANLHDDELKPLPDLLVQITALARAHAGFVEILTGPLVLVTFGVPCDDPSGTDHRRRFAAGLATSLGDRARILHGSRSALVGSFGSGTATFYGSLLHRFSDLLKDLASLAPGETREAATTS